MAAFQPLPPETIEPLGDAIGDRFPPPDLNLVLLKTTGLGLFQEYVGEGDPFRVTARKLLLALEERGSTVIVLAELLARRRDDPPFRDLVGRACPAALVRLPTTDENVGTVVGGLHALRLKLADPAARAALAASHAQLATIADSIDRLSVYKNLHDCLHQLQVKQLISLRLALKRMSSDPLQVMELRSYQGQLRSACLFARGFVEALPPDPIARTRELSWIDDLEAASEKFHEAIELRLAREAKVQLATVRRIMQQTLAELNRSIFTIAKSLPLADLATALGALAGSDDPVAKAQGAVLLVAPTINARVLEHKLWQHADDSMSDLNELVGQQPANLIEEFSTFWPDLRNQISALITRDAAAAWAVRLTRYGVDVEDFLAREVADDALLIAFDAYRGEAQLRFLAVDAGLKFDCAALVRIGGPLHDALSELS